MTFTEAEETLRKISFLHFRYELYRLGTGSWSGSEAPYGEYRLQIKVTAPDTRDRNVMGKFIHERRFPAIEFMSIKDFIEIVFERTLDVLKHEAGEIFKVGDIDPFNEHDNAQEKWKLIATMFTRDIYTFPDRTYKQYIGL